jgi:hypothetical protein
VDVAGERLLGRRVVTDRTPEQVAADAALAEAVRAALVAGGHAPADAKLVTFMVVGEALSPEQDDDGRYVARRFFRLHSGGSEQPDVTLALWLTGRASAELEAEFLREAQ